MLRIKTPINHIEAYQYLKALQREHCLTPGLPQTAHAGSLMSTPGIWVRSLWWSIPPPPSKLASTSKYFDAVFFTKCSNPNATINRVNINWRNQFRSQLTPATCIYAFPTLIFDSSPTPALLIDAILQWLPQFGTQFRVSTRSSPLDQSRIRGFGGINRDL